MLISSVSRGYYKLVPFNIRLREVRNEKGKKQKECAECLGIQVRSYQAYEGGDREPSIQYLIALADFFDVTLDYLMGRTDS